AVNINGPALQRREQRHQQQQPDTSPDHHLSALLSQAYKFQTGQISDLFVTVFEVFSTRQKAGNKTAFENLQLFTLISHFAGLSIR
ncbi:MAG TPA: hypothetical protein VFG19_07550, partial [Geobacteraceae bacterium]|nr:hypothetical protein [Geobacteraceae bacterium]